MRHLRARRGRTLRGGLHFGAILARVHGAVHRLHGGVRLERHLGRAVDALETMLMAMIEDKEAIPEPKAIRRRDRFVTLPVLTEAKIDLYREMRSSRIGKAELARRLNCHLPQIDRLLDLGHASRLDQLEQAFAALGKRLTVSIEDAA